MERIAAIFITLVVAIVCLPLSERVFPLFFGGAQAPPLLLRHKIALVALVVGIAIIVCLVVKP